jgi:hypothetical protein
MGWQTTHSGADRRSLCGTQTTIQVWPIIELNRPLQGEPGGRTIGADSSVLGHFRIGRLVRLAGMALFSVAIHIPAVHIRAQAPDPAATGTLPDAPDPQTPPTSQMPEKKPCPPKASKGSAGGNAADPGLAQAVLPVAPAPCKATWGSRYEHFADGPRGKSLTPKDKAWLAARNIADPFNIITILGNAAITVGSDSHTPYGPGMSGFGKYVGVSFSQAMTGEFVGTFLISSIAHQDPRYHSMPHASIPRRVGHGILQVVWTRGDNGKGMPNYATLVGYAIDGEISNLYVPGRETDASASATRYATGLAFSPIDNFITEFLPDVASHIKVKVVIVQRVINQVARSEGGSQP